MVRLLDLPDEIHLQICDWILQDLRNDPRRCLYQLCLVHSILRNIAQPILFRKYANEAAEDAQLYLLRTVAECAHLRPHVTCLRGLHEYAFDLPYDFAPLEDAIRSLGVDFTEEWIKALAMEFPDSPYREERIDALVSLLWALLPNIEYATLRWPYGNDVILRKLIGAHHIPSWSKVQHLRIKPSYGEDDVDGVDDEYEAVDGSCFAVVAAMLTMPQLQDVDLRSIIVTDKTFELSPKTITARHLTLSECDLDARVVRMIIEGCISLESAEYSEHAHANTPPTPRELMDLLALHGATLRRLILDLSDYYAPQAQPSDETNSLAWDRLPALRELDIDRFTLEYSSREIVLPRGLALLHVREVSGSFAAAMEGLVERLDGYPHLTDIILEMTRHQRLTRFRRVEQRLAGTRVTFALST